MSTPAPAAPQLKSPNLFELATRSGKTKVTYYPSAPGPLIAGQTPGGGLFEYVGPEGNLTFRGPQITQQDTPSGSLLTVILKPQFDAGSTSFSLFLPPVSVDGSTSAAFTTYAVKAHHKGLFITAGAQITYECESFHGSAKSVMLPL